MWRYKRFFAGEREEKMEENNLNMQENMGKFDANMAQPPKRDHKKAWKITRIVLEIIVSVLFLLFFFTAGSVQSNYEYLEKNYNKLAKEYDAVVANYTALEKEYSSYKKEMEPFEEMTAAQAEADKLKAEQEKKAIEEAEEKKKAAEEAEAQKKAAEAEAARKAEEAKGYETGITYDQLARTPDDFMGKKVKFYGKVVQVIENGTSVQIRLAVDDNYDTILLGEYDSSIVSSRVLDDDLITIYGTSVGTISYQSTMGGTITIPGVMIDKIDQ